MLLDGDEYRFYQEGGGNHRVAALAALGYEEAVLQVRTKYVVRRSEAKWWPMVRLDWFSEQEAIAVFDRIFCGE
jgi:hypothetical protein